MIRNRYVVIREKDDTFFSNREGQNWSKDPELAFAWVDIEMCCSAAKAWSDTTGEKVKVQFIDH
jgi:hypothetical protein